MITTEKHLSDAESLERVFEGPEKLLEIWFEPIPDFLPADVNGRKGLRKVGRAVWDELLGLVECKILNVVSSDDVVDAYLLSESSMFVYPHKLILKTCGSTVLLIAIPKLLEIASEICELKRIWRVFYSRKSFMFPEKQRPPHTDWKDEVAFLDKIFGKGAAYVVGKINGDHWNLYMTSPQEGFLIPDVDVDQPGDFSDQTIEILMSDLDEDAMRPFYSVNGETMSLGGERINKETGLGRLYSSALLDSCLFDPCGYSANGLLGDCYFTIHVTPEPSCSYASFETNIPYSSHGSMSNLISNVIDVFRPGKFSVTLFVSVTDGRDKKAVIECLGDVSGYAKKDKMLYEFDGYDFLFGHYE
ncbi:7457_t:CDS:2, partial [Paraglomus occultum]